MKYSIQKIRIVLSVGSLLLMFCLVSLVQAEDVIVKDNTNTVLAPRTSMLHHKIVDDMIGATVGIGINNDEGDFCSVADEAFVALPLDSRISFAWNSTSYKDQIASPEIESINKDLFEMTKKTLEDSNPHLDILIAKNDNDKFMLSRARALSRSSLVELMYESKKEDMDTVRLGNLFEMYNASISCVLEYATNFSGNKNAYDFIGENRIAYATFWDSKKGELGVEPTQAPTPLSISVKSGMTQDDSVMKINIPDDVSSKAQLESYAYSVIADNSYIKSIDITEDSIAVKYNEKVKLFGFIPMYMGTKAVVSDSKTVENKTPWYRFMVARKMPGLAVSDFKENLDMNVKKPDIKIDGINGENINISTTTKMTLKEKAHALNAMSHTIKNAYEGNTINIETTTEGNNLNSI